MAKYSGITKEETFKAEVFRDFFSNSKYAYQPNIDNIDFIVTEAKTLKDNMWTRHYLWAESKKGVAEIYDMLTQLVLTSQKTYEKGEHLPPPYIACFDNEKIAFVPFHDILPIFTDNDVDWSITPSNYNTDNFQKTKKKVEKLSKRNIVIFNFDTDDKEIKDFINNNLVAGNITSKFQINKNNFVIIYTKWYDTVRKSIAIDWKAVSKAGIIDGDFFLADLLSKDDYTLKDKLFVILQNNQYKFDKKFDEAGFSLYKEVGFNDNQKAHKAFWDKYERPPLEEYWDYIINRRDLLVPQDIRERKGSFFTPRLWVEKSQEYLEAAFGENWQDEYYIWDCAAGTGNLLAGLINKANIWASTLDKADVDVMKDRIKNGANLLEDNVFQFDFLNDEFSKLPKSLQTVIKSKEKRKKLIIYINPPYAENGAGVGKGAGKAGVSSESRIYDKYTKNLGRASRELFTQFFIRIYNEIPDCKIASFGKLKYVNAPNFKKFRDIFKCEYKKGFVCRANTFDNVEGNFPISFLIWDLEVKNQIKKITCDILDNNGNIEGKKNYYSYFNSKYINDWIAKFPIQKDSIGTLFFNSNDFQHQKFTYLSLAESASSITAFPVNQNNLINACIYFTVRLCIESNWLNDRDQFLYPNDKYINDVEFQNDCFTYALFHGQNRVTSNDGTNFWIPFTTDDVKANGTFESNFIYDFINGKIELKEDEELDFTEKKKTKLKALKFSKEAKAVFKAGKELWKYYHSQPGAMVNASFYDIRERFQGRDDSGRMNPTSGDDTYNMLIKALRQNLSILAEKIEPKVYEYGFLKK